MVKYSASVRHVDSGTAPLHGGVGKNGEDSGFASGNIPAFHAVPGGPDVREGGFHGFAHKDASVHASACLPDQRTIGADADGNHKHIELYGFPAFHIGDIFIKALRRISQEQRDSVLLQMPFQDRGAVFVQAGAHGMGSQIADRDLPGPPGQTLRAFQTDKTRADDQNLRRRSNQLFQIQRILHGGKEKTVLDGFQSLKFRRKGGRACADAQRVVGQRFTV